MKPPLLIPWAASQPLVRSVSQAMGAEICHLETRQFPDGETYLRYPLPVKGRSVSILCSLDHPNDKILPLVFAAATARDLEAASVGLVSPYLAYMRQDRQFRSGEAVTSRHFARLLSQNFDWLVTVDPHLHRFASLDEIYTIPTTAIHSAPLVAGWIKREVERPLLVGPDSESEQWVSDVAKAAGAPHIVLQKVRRGDRDVEISLPDVESWRDRTPVLVDDIVSTARTMIGTIAHLKAAGMRPPICIAVHGLFAGDAYAALLAAGAARIVTTNTVQHPTNAIEISDLISKEANALIANSPT